MDNEHSLSFTKIIDNVLGAEGPVFTPDRKFYMVAPEVEVNNEPAGQVLEIDIDRKQVRLIVIFFKLCVIF